MDVAITASSPRWSMPIAIIHPVLIVTFLCVWALIGQMSMRSDPEFSQRKK